MSKISFIIQQKSALSLVDWDSLINEQDPEMILVLISERSSIDSLGTQAKKRFTAIIELEQFEFVQAKKEMDKIFAQHYQMGDQTNIATLHEFQLELAAQLRDHYREAFNTQGPGIDVIQNFRNKLLMKKHLGPKGVKLPNYTEFDSEAYKHNPEAYLQSIEQLLGFPMFAKPVDSAGSINTAFIQDTEALRAWSDKASESSHVYEIDEFIDGTLFHCDSVVKNGQVQFTLVSQYLHPNADALSGKALATMTLNPGAEDYKRLKQFAEEALSHFPILPDGVTHLEVFKKTSNNELVFLEVAARAPGGVAPEMYQIRTGVDIRQLHLRLHLGLSIEDSIRQLHDQSKWGPFASMYQLVAPYHGGTISKLKPPVFHGGDYKIEWRCRENDIIKPASSIANVIVSTVFWNDDYDALEQDFRLLDQQQIVEIIPTQVFFLQEHFNRLETLGCTSTSYPPTFFSKRNLAIGAASMFSQISAQAANTLGPNLSVTTEIDPVMFLGLLVSSVAIVVLIVYALYKVSPTQNDVNKDEEHLVPAQRFL